MKKNGLIAVTGVLLAMGLAGCNAMLNDDFAKTYDYGSLVVKNGDESARSIYTEGLSFTKATVSGYGINSSLESEYIALSNGGASNLEIQKIPVGKNRIVTAYAYDSEKNKLGSVMVRNITSIAAGSNSVSVDKNTTALGNVFNSLLTTENYDISSITQAEIVQIGNAIDSEKSWALIDTASIAKDFAGKSLKASSSYVLTPGSMSFKNNVAGITIQVGDPVSSKLTAVAAGNGTLSNIAPGTWPVYIIKQDGSVEQSFVKVTAGETADFGEIGVQQITGKIILHVETSAGYSKVYGWISAAEKLFGEWPGTAMTDADSDGWYDVVIEKTAANVIFNGNGQTPDLAVTEGEWWYQNGKFLDANPTDSVSPVLESFTASASGTVSGNLTLSISASDNKSLKNAVIAVDGIQYKTVTLSGKTAEKTVTVDTTDFANGQHTVTCVVYDASNKVSEVKTLTFTCENANTAPVAAISGASRAAPGKTVTFSGANSKDKNGSVVEYKWTVTGAAFTGTGAEISVTAPSAEDSEFTVTLKVKDNEGAWSEEVSQKVTVKTYKSNDFREETIYFAMTARFYDGDSSNNRWCRSDMDGSSGNKANDDYPWRGDFKGLIQKLDYIKAMGFSAIWITPPVLNRSDFDFHGYHAWNMNKIDPRLESADADYQALIDACHAKGIKVIQDIVLNHSSRYGLEDLFVPKHYGSKSITWGNGKGIGAEYYDDYNPNFTYNGLDAEPNSGKTFYNGDLWQEEKPANLWWNPDLSDWGVHNSQYDYYFCQWPTLKLYDPNYYHQTWLGNWEDETCQSGTIHEDCVDLNTENAAVQKYLIDAYSKYIKMGVDAFRIDTVKHVSRVMFNRHFVPAFKKAAAEAGNDNFYMFGEVCTRVNEVWNHGVAPLSTPFYTWKERQTYSDDDSVAVHEGYEYEKNMGPNNQPVSDNHSLTGTYGNDYHKPDYSQSSGLNVIDFPMHWNFANASQAYNMRSQDYNYNDATWNVVYVDSHDYGPNMDNRYPGDTNAWAENMTYMWTFRGIPCLYYGSEIRFKAGADADKGPSAPLENTGRAYYGDNIEGTITATDYGEWKDATGALATTMESPLIPHLAQLNKIRRAVPALQKGQYSNTGCDGQMAFKRRFTDEGIDSFVLVTIGSGATFSNLPAGTYVDLVTGDSKTVAEGGSIAASCSGSGNARIYVLQNATAAEKGATGKISGKSSFLK